MCVERQHFLELTTITFWLGRGQAGARERSREKTHPFLLLGSLQVAGKWDTSGLTPPTPRGSEGLTPASAVTAPRSHTTLIACF